MAASFLNGYANRDRISKFERGLCSMDLFDYLRLMWSLRDFAPGHPAVALAQIMLPRDVLAGVKTVQASSVGASRA
jgi:hypothetical protein